MKAKILNRINDEIKELQEKVNLIENLEIAPVDKETWQKICLTPARYEGSLILEIAKKTFPQGENFEKHPNEITFSLNGFDIELPTSTFTGIKIDLGWFNPSYKELPKEYTRFDNMRKYFELLDSNNYTWYDLAYCRCNNRDIKESKFKIFLWWFCKAKWRKVDRKKWDDMFKHEDEQTKIKLENHYKKVEEIEAKLNKVNDVIDTLRQFGEVKGFVRINGVWQTTNVENYFR